MPMRFSIPAWSAFANGGANAVFLSRKVVWRAVTRHRFGFQIFFFAGDRLLEG
jgi:hypothetical protein